MSRFFNLEFDGASEDLSSQKAPVKDEGYYLGEAQGAFANGAFESALRLYSKVLEFNPQNATAWAGQVRMLIELGEIREARLWAEKALERFPREAELLAAKAVALARDGDVREALALSDASIQERGETPYVWLARADVLLAHAERRADYCFDKALLLAPRDWFVSWLAARVRFYYRQFALALKLIEQALGWNSTHFLLWLELGRCQKALGLVGSARESLRQAGQLNPQCREVGMELAKLSETGLWPRMRGWWHRAFHS